MIWLSSVAGQWGNKIEGMGLSDFFKWGKTKAKKIGSVPQQMILRFLPSGQVMWMPDNTETWIEQGYQGNHAVFTIQDWKSAKVASCPPIVYEVTDEKSYKLYKAMLKNPTRESLLRAGDLRRKSMREVANTDMQKVLDRPNQMMTWYEFAYGGVTFKDMCGSEYIGATRNGVSDPTTGAITEMTLLPSQYVTITVGNSSNPIKEYVLSTNPDVPIDARNVLQIRNFSPDYKTYGDWLYGQSRLKAARNILQDYNSSVEASASIMQDKGVRDIVFPKNHPQFENDVTPEQAQDNEDVMNRKLKESGNGGVITSSAELGVIRIGFSPTELGILDSKKLTKTDFCALYHIPDIIFGWSDQTTYNNLSEARKIGITDAVLPELEQLADGLNSWLVPSYTDVKQSLNNQKQNLVIGFDHEYFSELQEDKAELIKWLEKSPVTPNEWRRALHYDDSPEENANKIMVPSGMKLLEDMGFEIGTGDPSTFGGQEN